MTLNSLINCFKQIKYHPLKKKKKERNVQCNYTEIFYLIKTIHIFKKIATNSELTSSEMIFNCFRI